MKKELSDRLPLGKHTDYIASYSPQLLVAIPRRETRERLGLDGNNLPFLGGDYWNAYEMSWLNARGKPEVAVAEFYFPCDSQAIIESKSFKLYLNSFNQTRYASLQDVRQVLVNDLGKAAQTVVDVGLNSPDQWPMSALGSLQGCNLDELDISVDDYSPAPERLTTSEGWVSEQLYSHVLRSLCPVTGQPDWASVHIAYTGQPIDHEGLLRYIIGYREHQEFHEQCVERIYTDIHQRCLPERLSVYARYVRRGGLDINPFRSSHTERPENPRLYRQ